MKGKKYKNCYDARVVLADENMWNNVLNMAYHPKIVFKKMCTLNE